jgi:hypothetical protein
MVTPRKSYLADLDDDIVCRWLLGEGIRFMDATQFVADALLAECSFTNSPPCGGRLGAVTVVISACLQGAK